MPGKLILRTGVEKWAKNKFKDLEGRFREIWKHNEQVLVRNSVEYSTFIVIKSCCNSVFSCLS